MAGNIACGGCCFVSQRWPKVHEVAENVSVMHADGAVQLELDESSLMYSVARRNADGTIERVCVEGSEAANKALKAPKFASRPVSKAAKEQLK